MLRSTSVVMTTIGASPLMALSPVSRQPLVDQRYIDGEIGDVELVFGPDGDGGYGPASFGCDYVIEPSTTSAITFDVTARATTGVGRNRGGAPVTAGRCSLKITTLERV